MALSSTDLWNKYVTQLTNYITGGQFDKDNQAICFSGNTLMVDLINTDPEIINGNIYSIGNVIPKCSPTYAPQSSLIGAYSSFLNHINLGGNADPNLDNLIISANIKLNTATDKFNAQFIKSLATYQGMKQAIPDLDWSKYVLQYGSAYIVARDAMNACQSEYDKYSMEKYGADYNLIMDARKKIDIDAGAMNTVSKTSYNMLSKLGSQSPLPGENPTDPSITFSTLYEPGYQLDSAFTIAYKEWQVKSVNDTVDAGPIEVSGTTNAEQYSEFGWDASIGGSCFGDFFSVFGSGSASGQTINQSWQSTNFNLKMSYTGLQTFKIEPYPWFDQNLITEYKDKLLPDSPNFFGKDGALSLLPYEIIVGFEPKLELTLDNSDYKEFKNSFNASTTASLSIGPFRIGKASTSTYSKKSDVSFSDETSTITVGPIKSTLPLLLGVICSKL
jgi:hypothetical protein